MITVKCKKVLHRFDRSNNFSKDGSIIKYHYDTMGNRTAVKIGSETTSYTFDEMNRLKTVTDPDGGMTTYAYDKNGNRESVIYPNGTVA